MWGIVVKLNLDITKENRVHNIEDDSAYFSMTMHFAISFRSISRFRKVDSSNTNKIVARSSPRVTNHSKDDALGFPQMLQSWFRSDWKWNRISRWLLNLGLPPSINRCFYIAPKHTLLTFSSLLFYFFFFLLLRAWLLVLRSSLLLEKLLYHEELVQHTTN